MITRVLRNERGVVAVEFALILPIALALLLGSVQLGFAFLFYTKLNFAVEAASRCYALAQCADGDAAISYARARASLPGADDLQDWNAGTASCGAWVSGAYLVNTVQFLSPITLSASSCYPLSPAPGG